MRCIKKFVCLLLTGNNAKTEMPTQFFAGHYGICACLILHPKAMHRFWFLQLSDAADICVIKNGRDKSDRFTEKIKRDIS